MPRPPLGLDLRAVAKQRGVRRKSVTLPAIVTTRAQSDALARHMVAVVDIWAQMPWQAEYARTLTTDSIPDLEAIIASTDERAVRATLDFGSWFRGWAAQLAEWHWQKIVGAMLSQLKIDLRPFQSAINDPAVIEAAVARNVSLVRNVSDDTRGKISDAIFRGQQAGTSVRDVAKEVSEILGKSKDRAKRIATDQTAKLGATLDQQRQEAMGFTEFEWMHSRKLHFRPEHVARDGKVYPWRGNDLNGDLPGVAPFCFPSGQPVAFHDDAVMLWRRWHRGELTEITTVSGAVIRTTPNHPVLTRTGWKAAQALNVGDYLVESGEGGVLVAQVDIVEAQPRIGDLFEAGKALFGSVTRNGTGAEFHGDATVDEQIEIVDAQGGLRSYIVSAATENYGQVLLEQALNGGFGVRTAEFLRQCGGGPGTSLVGVLNLLEALLWAQVGPSNETGRAVTAELDSLLNEASEQGWSRDTHAFRNRIRAFAGEISSDSFRAMHILSVVGWARNALCDEPAPIAEVFGQSVARKAESGSGIDQPDASVNEGYGRIESVVSRPWEGHVYNLETVSGWYSAGKYAVKNCGCKAKAHLDLD